MDAQRFHMIMRWLVPILALMLCGITLIPTVSHFVHDGLFGVDYQTIARGLSRGPTEAYSHQSEAFAYPPTARLFLWPMTFLGFPGFALASAALFLLACRQHLSWVELLLVSFGFAFLNVVLVGQVTFLVVGLMLFGLSCSDRRWAGVAFAVAAAIKPQSLLLVPIYLIVTRDWRCLVWTATAFIFCLVASAVLFGMDAWTAWPGALRNYANVVQTSEVIRWAVTPIGISSREGFPVVPIAIAGAMLAALILFLDYADPIETLFGLTLGTLLILPFGTPYDLLGLIPLLARRIVAGKPVEVLPYSLYWPMAAIAASVICLLPIARRGLKMPQTRSMSGPKGQQS